MCFTPAISLTTAIIEFFLATFILFKFRRSLATRYAAILIYILGLYQLTEFGLCSYHDPHIWARAAFLTYNSLPAIGLFFALHFTKVKRKWIALLPAIIFSIPALLAKDFVLESSCTTTFVVIRTLVSSPQFGLWLFYAGYYSTFILAAGIILWKQSRKTSKAAKKFYNLWVTGILLMTLPALILLIIFPALDIVFPSLYCEFALLFALFVFAAAAMDHKHKIVRIA